MESRHRAPEEVAPDVEPDAADDRWRWRLRLIAGCLLLAGLAFIQSPGSQVADTKFDLVADPGAFLSRATHLWDSAGAFGQLQNQAYGYLWPMGPFFLLGSLIDLPGWVIQRLWMALVMGVAFVGGAKVAKAMGVRSEAAALIAAFAYATSPRMLSTIGPISSESWPSALAPWVLLPLVIGSLRGSPRRAAAWSGLAVAMAGGVNAAATFAVIPLGALWLLTREPGPRRRSLMLWWPIFTLLGTLWWLVPLFVMGAYSPPFLDFIETASVTTFPTTPFDSLRGTSDWVAYVDPTWVGGNALVTDAYTVINSAALLVLGLVGIMLPRRLGGHAHRQFLALGVLVGMLMVTLGHTGAVEGWFAGSIADALDGVLAPIRNVHKFDPIVRLPLILGLAFCIDRALATRGTSTVETTAGPADGGRRLGVAVIAGLAVIGAAGPAITGDLAPSRPVYDTPGYWADAVTWLDDQEAPGTALLAPGSGFGDYIWGFPRDEPVQYLGADHWAVRNAIPLTPPGNIRMLDAIEKRFAQGQGSPGFAGYLRRAGVQFVVVRNDLRPDSDVPDPVLVREVLEASPGITRVKTFGPEVGGGPSLQLGKRRTLVNYGRQEPRKAIEVYQVDDASRSVAVTTDQVPVVVGGPEDLLSLEDAGILGGASSRLASDLDREEAPGGPLVLTDGLQQRERFFGRVHDAEAPVTVPGDVNRSGNPTPDYLLPSSIPWLTRAEFDGAKSLSASSSMSDSDTIGGTRVAESPWAAIDGNLDSEWVSGEGEVAAPWWQVDLEESTALSEVVVTGGSQMEGRQQIRIRTDSGVTEPVTLRPGGEVTIPLDGEPTRTLRVERLATGANQLALAEVGLEGVGAVNRPLVLPALPSTWKAPDAIVLRRLADDRTGCVDVSGTFGCVETETRSSEESTDFSRVVRMPQAHEYDVELTGRPRAGAELDALIQKQQPLQATGSSVGVPNPRAAGLAAIDGDVGTSWTPRIDDIRPVLALNWIGKRKISGLQLTVGTGAPVRRPTELKLTWPGGSRDLEVPRSGRVKFPAIRTDQLTLRITADDRSRALDSRGQVAELPIGISELRLDGMKFDPVTVSAETLDLPCGSGPTYSVDGLPQRTRAVASAEDLYRMRTIDVEPCGKSDSAAPDDRVFLGAGESEVSAFASDLVTPDQLLMTADVPATSEPLGAGVKGLGSTDLTLDPDPEASTLVLRQNVNPGWEATQDGQDLRAVTIDGWQQGWQLRSDSDASVEATFAPDGAYRTGLAGGAVAVLGLVGLCLFWRRWGRDDQPAVGARTIGTVPWLAVILVSAGLLGGLIGLMGGVVGVAAGVLVVRSGREGAVWAMACALLITAGAYYLRPWANFDGWAGDLAWAGHLVIVVLSGVAAVAGDLRRPGRRRIAGISTSR